ncbi:hypothetical protein TNCV_763931 [Trichonephila clavipes]|nr:hypothetical protein TNCV_763931 [Trichonephila clavipes]
MSRRVNRGIVLLEPMAFTQRGVLKQRGKIICENASIMVTCGHHPEDMEMPQFTGMCCTPYHHETPSTFHGWNQAINLKYFYICSTDEPRPVV